MPSVPCPETWRPRPHSGLTDQARVLGRLAVFYTMAELCTASHRPWGESRGGEQLGARGLGAAAGTGTPRGEREPGKQVSLRPGGRGLTGGPMQRPG